MGVPKKALTRQRQGYKAKSTRPLYRNPTLPRDWRQHLPNPANYYTAKLGKLTGANADGWAQSRCPFHEDKQASLSVNLTHGGWRCFANCGSGDMVSFHQRLTRHTFKAAVRDLIGGAQ